MAGIPKVKLKVVLFASVPWVFEKFLMHFAVVFGWECRKQMVQQMVGIVSRKNQSIEPVNPEDMISTSVHLIFVSVQENMIGTV